MPPQLAQPLRRGQGLPGDGPGGPGHLQGQEAVALLPRRLHGGEHLRVVQHQAAAGELLVQLLAPGLVAHGAAPTDHRVPGGEVEHTGPLHRPAVVLLPPVLQGEQVQEHLKPQAVPHLGEVEGFFARLIIDHSQIELSVVDPAVHPVHKAGDAQGHPVHGELHRGQLPPLSEAQLEGDGTEFGGGQLLGHIVHHRLDRPEQAAEQIPEPLGLVLQPPQLLLDVALHRRLCQLPQPPAVLRPPDGVVPAGEDSLLKHLVLEHMLQHIVDKSAVLRCCKASRLAGLRLQAIAHEVGEVAGFVFVHPGGGHGHPLAVEAVHRRGGQVSPLPPARPVQTLHRRGVLWQLGQGVVGRPAPPRLLQGGQRSRQAEGPLEVLLPLYL